MTGLKARICSLVPGGECVSCYRHMWPAHYLAEGLLARGVKLELRSSYDLDDLDKFTHFMVSSFNSGFTDDLSLLRLYKKCGKKFIWMVDDDLWNWPGEKDRRVLDAMRWEIADWIVVTNEECRRLVRRPERTRICPVLTPPDFWPPLGPRPKGPLRLLWSGSALQGEDTELGRQIVERIDRELWPAVEVYKFGGQTIPEWVHHPRIRQWPDTDFHHYLRLIVPLRPDVAIIPRVDRMYNRCKSHMKYLEMSMVGAATVALDLPNYAAAIEDGVDGLLCGEGPDEWFEAVNRLADYDFLREEMAAKAREKTLREFSWSCPEKREQWLDVLEECTT